MIPTMNSALTQSQLESFFSNGYIKIPAIVPPSLLGRLRSLFDELMYKQPDPTASAILQKNGKDYVTNLEQLCIKGDLACLELLGSPFLLEIAECICGTDFFLIQEFAVIKNLGDKLPVLWHQDMVHQRSGNCFTVGVYLDDVKEGDGALRIVPGSHLSGKDVCESSREPFIEIPMEAGGILIHDMMLAHSSEPLQKNKLRRVIYFEFLSATQVLGEKIYGRELLINRMQLIHAAIHYYNQLHPGEKGFHWKNDIACSIEPIADLKQRLNDIYSISVHARPSAYCLEQLQ